MAVGDISDALRDRVRSRVGEASKQGLLDAEIFDHLNRAQFDVGWRLNDAAMPEMTAVASGTLTNSRVALPATFWRERQVLVGAAEVVARRWDVTELDALTDNVMTTPSLTSPYYYIWYNVTDVALRLCVEAGEAGATAAYKLYYVTLPTEMTTTVDPVFSADIDDLLVDFAVARCREMRKQYGEAERIMRQYFDRVRAINSRFVPGVPYQGVPGDT